MNFFSQFGNTCYCNSVLQALYFCKPFREKVLQYKQQQKSAKRETLLSCLSDLFHSIATQKKKVGTIAPKKFIQKLKKENGKNVMMVSQCMPLTFTHYWATSQCRVVEMSGECDCTETHPKWRVAQLSNCIPCCIFRKILWHKNVNNCTLIINLFHLYTYLNLYTCCV